MKGEHRSILAIVISIAFFAFWYLVVNPQKSVSTDGAASKTDVHAVQATAAKQPDQTVVANSADTGGKTSEVASEISSPDPQASLPIKTWTIKNNLVDATFTTDGGVLTAWKLNKYRKTVSAKSPLMDLVASAGTIPPLSLKFEKAKFKFPQKPRFELIAASEHSVSFRWKSDDVLIVKTITLKPNSYLADVNVKIKSINDKAITAKPVLLWSGLNGIQKKSGFLGLGNRNASKLLAPTYYMGGKIHRNKRISKLSAEEKKTGDLFWAGIEGRYFLSSIIPRVQGEGVSVEYGVKAIKNEPGKTSVWIGASLPSMDIPAGSVGTASFSVYSGPKEIKRLKAVGVHLDSAINYGWFTVIAIPILYLLKFFHGLVHDYGVAIILLTVFVKLLLHPINKKSLKSMKAMQQLQPRLKEIQKKHKDDKQKLNQETMQLFKAHKVNPMGGCLPMIAQFPIYIALYKVLWNSIEVYHAPFLFLYKDMSASDPYYIMPIILGLFMVAQQKLTPSTSADPAQKKMMMIMPVMFTVFMLFLPVGLVLYILVNTAMSVIQQWMYNKDISMLDLIRGKWRTSSAA